LHRHNGNDTHLHTAGWDSQSKPHRPSPVESQQGPSEDADMESTQTQDDARDDGNCIAAVTPPQGDLNERYGVILGGEKLWDCTAAVQCMKSTLFVALPNADYETC